MRKNNIFKSGIQCLRLRFTLSINCALALLLAINSSSSFATNTTLHNNNLEKSSTETANVNTTEPQSEALATLKRLTDEAQVIEGGKDLAAYNAAWGKVKDKAIEIYGKDHFEARYSDGELAFQHFYKGEFKRAFDIIAPLVEEMQQLGEQYNHRRILLTQKLVPLYTNLGQGDKAILLQEEVLAYWRTSSDDIKYRKIVNSLNNLSSAKLQRGAPLEALKYADEALAIIAAHKDLESIEPYLLYNRTNYLSAAGRNNEAMLAARYGIRRMAERGETKHLLSGFLLTSLATQLHYEGRYEASIDAANASVSMLQAIYSPHAPRVYQVQTVLLGLLIKQGEYTRAINLANNLLPVLEESDGSATRNYLFFAMGKARAEFLQQPSSNALSKYSAAIAEYESVLGKNNRFSVGARTNEMLLTAKLGDYKNASKLAMVIEQHYSDVSQQNTLAAKSISAYVGYYDLLLGNADGLNKVYSIYEGVKDDFQSRLRITDKAVSPNIRESNILQISLEAAVKAKDLSRALEIAQLYTHGGPRTALAKAKVRKKDLPKDTLHLIRQRQDILEQQAALINERDFAYQQQNNALVVKLSTQHDAITADLALATKTLTSKFPQWIEAEEIQFADVNTIQGRLTQQEALLMPVVVDSGIVIFSFTHKKATVEFVRLDALTLRKWVTEFRESVDDTGLLSLSGTNEPALNIAIKKSAEVSHKIYNHLFTTNVKEAFANKSILYVSSNSYLSTLPFSALATSKSVAKTPKYLLDNFAIVNVPYIGAFSTNNKSQERHASRFIGIGAPASSQVLLLKSEEDASFIASLPALPNAIKELDAIAQMDFQTVKLLTGEAATESNVKAMSPKPSDVIVFASHGLLAGELVGLNEPALVLAPSQQEDGILSAKEIAQLDFPAGFIVLSACNTGGEGSGSAEGLSGLASSFFYAGAENLLVSHWPVRDDVAAFLTINTIKNTQSGMPKAQALQKAMRDLRQHHNIANAAHPAIWSAFVLVTN